MSSRSRVAFVLPFVPHYRVRTFELMARRHDLEVLTFSDGAERFWMHDTATGAFTHHHLPGRRVLGTVFSAALWRRLYQGGYDLFVSQINGRFALPATWLAARWTGKPFVLWTGIWRHPRTPAQVLGFPAARRLYRSADAVVTYGHHVSAYLEGLGVAPDRLHVAPHAADPPRTTQPNPPGKRTFLFLGRLEREKGVAVLAEAFAGLDAELLVVGRGPERLDGPGIRNLGYVAPENAARWIAAADVLVLPSITTRRFREPWGLVVNEAFHQGRPAIVSDAVGAAAGGLVRDGETGLVVPEGDPAALRAAMARLLDDPALCRRLGENARRAVADYSQEHMAAAFGEVFDQLLAKGSR